MRTVGTYLVTQHRAAGAGMSSRYAKNHPAGRIGKRLVMRVHDVMQQKVKCASCSPEGNGLSVLTTLAGNPLANGAIMVVDAAGKLMGTLQDGDLRRALAAHGKKALVSESLVSVLLHPWVISLWELRWHRTLSISSLPLHAGAVNGMVGSCRRWVSRRVKLQTRLRSCDVRVSLVEGATCSAYSLPSRRTLFSPDADVDLLKLIKATQKSLDIPRTACRYQLPSVFDVVATSLHHPSALNSVVTRVASWMAGDGSRLRAKRTANRIALID
jgi:hypothetical protein